MKRNLCVWWSVPPSFRFVSLKYLSGTFFLTLSLFCCLYYRRLSVFCQYFFQNISIFFVFHLIVYYLINNLNFYNIFTRLILLFLLYCQIILIISLSLNSSSPFRFQAYPLLSHLTSINFYNQDA